jgi:tRNA(Ile)-lysidine synthase
LLQQLLEEKFARLLIAQGDMLVVQLEKLLELEPLDVWVYYLLRQYGFNRDTTDKITTAVKNKQTGSVFHAAAYNALVDRDYLLLKPVGEAETGVFLLEENTREIAEPIKMKIEASDLDDHFSLNRAEGVAQLDMDKLEFPLKIRKWQEGDRFVPLGMSGTKLVSDYFIDNKISRFDKERIWLLLSGNDIVWIIGYRISDKYKITSGTKRVLTITT